MERQQKQVSDLCSSVYIHTPILIPLPAPEYKPTKNALGKI